MGFLLPRVTLGLIAAIVWIEPVGVAAICNGFQRHEGCPCPLPKVYVRLPPSITANFDTNSSWQGPPIGWFYGNWKVAWSSNPTYKNLWNFEYDSSPVFPQAKNGTQINNDLTSWNAACYDDTEIFSAFGYDTERQPGSVVFDFQGIGGLGAVSNTWEMLAWGYDDAGIGYRLVHETPVVGSNGPADVNIEVRKRGHPTPKTKSALLGALRAFKVPALTRLANEVVELPHDDRRAGSPPYFCDAACVNNTYSAEAQKKLAKEMKECPRDG